MRIIGDIALKKHSDAPLQMASRMTVETYTADALKKIKGLISDMIAKLEKKAKADAKSENKK